MAVGTGGGVDAGVEVGGMELAVGPAVNVDTLVGSEDDGLLGVGPQAKARARTNVATTTDKMRDLLPPPIPLLGISRQHHAGD